MFQAIIFDMDGVLVDSEPLHIKAEGITLSRLGLNLPERELYQYMGTSTRTLFTDLISRYKLNTSIEELYPLHRDTLVSLYRTSLSPIPGALELLNMVKAQEIPLALASSSDMILIETVLQGLQLDHTFSAVVSGEEVDHFKPAPDIFILAAQRLSRKISGCLVIEDSTAGIASARAAGMTCIGFRSPNSRGQRYEQADYVVSSLEEIDLPLLEQLSRAD